MPRTPQALFRNAEVVDGQGLTRQLGGSAFRRSKDRRDDGQAECQHKVNTLSPQGVYNVNTM